MFLGGTDHASRLVFKTLFYFLYIDVKDNMCKGFIMIIYGFSHLGSLYFEPEWLRFLSTMFASQGVKLSIVTIYQYFIKSNVVFTLLSNLFYSCSTGGVECRAALRWEQKGCMFDRLN